MRKFLERTGDRYDEHQWLNFGSLLAFRSDPHRSSDCCYFSDSKRHERDGQHITWYSADFIGTEERPGELSESGKNVGD